MGFLYVLIHDVNVVEHVVGWVNTAYLRQSMLNMLVNDFLLVITELSHLLSAFSLSLTNLALYSSTGLHVS